MTDLSNPGLELATALEGIETLKRERAEYQHEWKRSMERLQGDVARLRGEIISGQKRLFEPEPERDVAKKLLGVARVVEFCKKRGHASVSEIAEHFHISTGEAVMLIDAMADDLEPANGSGPRKFREGA